MRHSGFSDPEQRYRQRYADLAVHPEVRALFRARSRDDGGDSRALDELDYLEVETPVLQPLYGGATARPFITHHNALDMPLYLRIADELYLKRLVVGGFDRVYEIGHDFRNEGIDRTHNPEFTMLEFYEAYADYTVMMSRVESLVVRAADAVRSVWSPPEVDQGRSSTGPAACRDFRPPFPRVEWIPSLNAALGADVMTMDDAAIRNAAQRVGVQKVGHSEPTQAAGRDVSGPRRIEDRRRRPSSSTTRWSCRRSPSQSAAIRVLTERFELFARGKRDGKRIQRAERSDRPASAVRGAGESASGGRRRGDRAWTRTICARWNTACRRWAVSVSESTGCSCI